MIFHEKATRVTKFVTRVRDFLFVYSVRSATTGSFLAALLAGRSPEMSVRATLSTMRMTALLAGRAAIFFIEVR